MHIKVFSEVSKDTYIHFQENLIFFQSHLIPSVVSDLPKCSQGPLLVSPCSSTLGVAFCVLLIPPPSISSIHFCCTKCVAQL